MTLGVNVNRQVEVLRVSARGRRQRRASFSVPPKVPPLDEKRGYGAERLATPGNGNAPKLLFFVNASDALRAPQSSLQTSALPLGYGTGSTGGPYVYKIRGTAAR